MIRGVATDVASEILRRIPYRKRLVTQTTTTDLSSTMTLTVRKVFHAAKLINVRFHRKYHTQKTGFASIDVKPVFVGVDGFEPPTLCL